MQKLILRLVEGTKQDGLSYFGSVTKEIIGKQFHSDKKAFEQAIVSLLEELANDEHQQNLRSLLNPEFQRFEKSQILGC